MSNINVLKKEIEFDDNRLISELYGEHGIHLSKIGQQLGITLISRGNQVTLEGPEIGIKFGEMVLNHLWELLKSGQPVTTEDVNAALHFIVSDTEISIKQKLLDQINKAHFSIQTKKRLINPRSLTQIHYIEALNQYDLVFGIGPAGTGKTYLAVAKAVSMLLSGQIERIILTRPAVEAGEALGFLPGDLKEKIDPYLRPLYDALHDMLPAEQVFKMIETGVIEIAPLAFMRGRTLSNAYVILDEAQNTTIMQMKMFLTRLGPNSRMAINGDITQIDLPKHIPSGLNDALDILKDVSGISCIYFSESDVVRHGLVAKIVSAYAGHKNHV